MQILTTLVFIDSNIINNIESAAYGFNYGIYCKKTYLTVFYPQYNSISGNKINGLSFKTAPFMGIYHDSNNYYTLIDNNSISNILVGDSTLNSINSFGFYWNTIQRQDSLVRKYH